MGLLAVLYHIYPVILRLSDFVSYLQKQRKMGALLSCCYRQYLHRYVCSNPALLKQFSHIFDNGIFHHSGIISQFTCSIYQVAAQHFPRHQKKPLYNEFNYRLYKVHFLPAIVCR